MSSEPRPPFAAVMLAAGKGTRMKSDLHKVLHPVAGRPMIAHLLAELDGLGPAAKVVVVGSGLVWPIRSIRLAVAWCGGGPRRLHRGGGGRLATATSPVRR